MAQVSLCNCSQADALCCFAAMPVEIQRSVSITMDGGHTWRVHESNIRSIDDSDFIKLSPSDPGFVRAVCKNNVEAEGRLSLSQSDGYERALALRNAVVSLPAADEADALFDAPPAKKGPRKSLQRMREIRHNPSVMEFELPACDGHLAQMITCVVPAHPRQSLDVMLDSGVIDSLFHYVRSFQLDASTVQSKRSYRNSGLPAGSMKNGADTFIVKLPADEAEVSGQKYKRFKSVAELLGAKGRRSGSEQHVLQDQAGAQSQDGA